MTVRLLAAGLCVLVAMGVGLLAVEIVVRRIAELLGAA